MKSFFTIQRLDLDPDPDPDQSNKFGSRWIQIRHTDFYLCLRNAGTVRRRLKIGYEKEKSKKNEKREIVRN